MPDRQIFFDPQRKRWKRLRRILDATAVISTLVLAGFIFNVVRNQQLPELLLPTPKHNYKALPDRAPLLRSAKGQRPARRKTDRRPSEIPFNTGEGLRAAYYVQDDAASYSSLKEHVHQIDMLFAQWFHVNAPSGTLMAMTGDNLHEYPVVEGNTVHDPDSMNRVKNVIQAAREDTEVIPHLNNYNPRTQSWDAGVGDVLKDEGKRAALREQILRFFAAYPIYPGLSLDIESLNDDAVPAYLSFIQELYARDAPAQSAPLCERGRVDAGRRTEADRRQLRRHCADELRRARGQQRSGPGGEPELVHWQPAAGSEDRAQGKDYLRGGQLRLRLDALDSRPEGPQASEAEGAGYGRPLGLRSVAARLGCRRRSGSGLRLSQSALRVH